MSSPLRIVFMGTPDFAVASLASLVNNNQNVVGVVTAPDKPAGRGRHVQESVVKQYALKQGLPLLQPTNLKATDFLDELRSLQADLFVVVAFRMLPEAVWTMPPKGTINLHASLLPQYRGAAPINSAIINGETVTGVTTFFIEKKIDTGQVIMRKEVPIDITDTAGDLHDRLMEVGADILLKTVIQIGEGTATPVHQAELAGKELRVAPKIYRETCRINWSDSTRNIYNHIRGLSPYPGAWSVLIDENNEEHQVKVFKATEAEPTLLNTGEIDLDPDMRVGTRDGSIVIEEIQIAGKRRMSTHELLNGFPITNRWKFN